MTSGSFNFGPDIKSNKTVQEVAKIIIQIFGNGKINREVIQYY